MRIKPNNDYEAIDQFLAAKKAAFVAAAAAKKLAPKRVRDYSLDMERMEARSEAFARGGMIGYNEY